MSDSVSPHRWQPTRLSCPWESPGKNTGVGCHFLLQCMKVKSESEVAQSYPTLSDPHGLQPTRLLRPWDFWGKSTGVGCHCLLLLYIGKTKSIPKCIVWDCSKLCQVWENVKCCEKLVMFRGSVSRLPIIKLQPADSNSRCQKAMKIYLSYA